MKQIENILKEYVRGIIKILGKNSINKIMLYGSYARGEQNQNGEISDIDIMIIVNLPENDIKKLEEKICDYSYELNLKYNILLSPIVDTVENYNKRVKYIEFYKNIQKEGVLLNG